jgi:hypothetical protein
VTAEPRDLDAMQALVDAINDGTGAIAAAVFRLTPVHRADDVFTAGIAAIRSACDRLEVAWQRRRRGT